MIKRFIAAIITATALGSPAVANELKDYIYSNPVLAEVHRSGTTIRFKDPTCVKGLYGSYTPKTDTMILCLSNHNNLDELADTIRHETIHIIQMCNGGPVMSFETIAKYAEPGDYRIMHNYANRTHHHEIEANLAARSMTDLQVVSSFKDTCYED